MWKYVKILIVYIVEESIYVLQDYVSLVIHYCFGPRLLHFCNAKNYCFDIFIEMCDIWKTTAINLN